jgi:2-phosphosulfolactate phosphatase
MGDNGIKRTDEDELCAIHLRNRLEGRPGDADAIRQLILAGGEVGRFHDPARPFLHPEDVDIALDIDRYNFAVRVRFENGRAVAHMERPACGRKATNPPGHRSSTIECACRLSRSNRPRTLKPT